MLNLLDFRNNKYSQNGEDGIISYILSILNIENGYFVEFGAADGKICSNTWSLVEKNWSGLYIEPREEYYQQCLQNTKNYPKVRSLQKLVKFEGPDTLDEILTKENVEYDFDVLSIDVDGDDYKIWEKLCNFKPKIVIIEINSAIPVGHYQIHNPPEEICTSFSSMVSLGVSKGYTPVCHTGNLIFIDSNISFPEVNFYMLTDWLGRFKNPFNLTN